MDYALFYATDTTLELCGYTDADLLGVARSNLRLLYLAQRLSIVELQWLHVR